MGNLMTDNRTNKRIKIAMAVTHFAVTGIGSVIMNYCSALDRNKYDFTIIAGVPIADQYREECQKLGINIVTLPSRHDQTVKHYIEMYKALKSGKYDIFHDHGNSSMMAIELTIAKLAGIKIRIAHSHNTRCPNVTVHKLLNPYMNKQYTKALACGEMAGDWLFGKGNFEVLPNGFETKKFQFSQDNRERIRAELKIADKFVIGHMGRINEQKNQEFLIDVFEKVAAVRKDAILMLVGDGPDTEKIKEKVARSQYKDRIILYGLSSRPEDMYSAFDLFVLPSRFEGLPVVLLEAQISGLPCVVSDKVTREVDMGKMQWASIDCIGDWTDKILKTEVNTYEYRSKYYEMHVSQIMQYDIGNTAGQLDEIYSNLINARR